MKKDSFLLILNIIVSLISFKQLFNLGIEEKLLDIKSVVLTPFVLSYSLIGLFMFSILFSFYKSIVKINFISIIKKTMILGILAIYILTPFNFLYYKNGHILTLPFILTLLEPFKVRFIYKQDYGIVLERNIILLIISFVLLFVSGVICKILNIEKTEFMYGGLYYLILAYLDYKIVKKNIIN
jgi:hypothetical protein